MGCYFINFSWHDKIFKKISLKKSQRVFKNTSLKGSTILNLGNCYQQNPQNYLLVLFT